MSFWAHIKIASRIVLLTWYAALSVCVFHLALQLRHAEGCFCGMILSLEWFSRTCWLLNHLLRLYLHLPARLLFVQHELFYFLLYAICFVLTVSLCLCLQCFDAVGWAAGTFLVTAHPDYRLGKPVPERLNQSGFKWGQRWRVLGMAVASAGPCANNLHRAADR